MVSLYYAWDGAKLHKIEAPTLRCPSELRLGPRWTRPAQSKVKWPEKVSLRASSKENSQGGGAKNSSEVEGVFWGASASNGGSHTFQSKTFSLNPKSPFSVAADSAGAFFSELADNVQRQDVLTYWRSSVHHNSQAHGIHRKLNFLKMS